MAHRRTIVIILKLLLSIAAIWSSGCLEPYQKKQVPTPSPAALEIRVGLMIDAQEVQFEMPEAFAIRNPSGQVIANELPTGNWRVTTLSFAPPRLGYRLLLATVDEQGAARAEVARIKRAGLQPDIIKQAQRQLPLRVGQEQDTRYRVVLHERFSSYAAAEQRRTELASILALSILEQLEQPASGQLLLQNQNAGVQYRLPDGSQFKTERLLLKTTASNPPRQTAPSYHGRISLHVSPTGGVTLVNSLLLEDYLAGVVPSEMAPGFPPAALQAQAITARNAALLSMLRAEPQAVFDICGDAGCQVYSGMSRRSPATDQAVRETAGLVMTVAGHVVPAFYSGVCGGHTEDNERIWSGAAQSHLRGRFDRSAATNHQYQALTTEAEVRAWLDDTAPAFCNLDGANVPVSLNYARKYYRWQERFSHLELEESIRRETGEEFGNLIDLQPLVRGVSGRITSLRIIGTRKTFELRGELRIRRALSTHVLPSALIAIDRFPQGSNDTARTFIIRGAGWGHGVGMCQIGAAMMALQGKSLEEILQHYYSGVRLQRAY